MSGENDNEAQRLAKLQSDLDAAREIVAWVAAKKTIPEAMKGPHEWDGQDVFERIRMIRKRREEREAMIALARTTLANIEKES